MNEVTAHRNKLHYASLAIVAAAVKAGVKTVTEFKVKRKLPKGTINKPSRSKPQC